MGTILIPLGQTYAELTRRHTYTEYIVQVQSEKS